MEKRHELLENKAIVLLRFSSHLGIACNEKEALEANVCLAFDLTHFMIPFFSILSNVTNKYSLYKWQIWWIDSIENKLLEIKTTIGEYQLVARNVRKKSRLAQNHVVILVTRLRTTQDFGCNIFYCTPLPFGM